MSNIFSEVYGTYYNIVAKILGQALSGRLTLEQLKRIVYKEGYEESALELLPALEEPRISGNGLPRQMMADGSRCSSIAS